MTSAWILGRLCRLLRKLVTPTVTSTVSLTVSQGPTGTAYNLIVVSTEGGKPDTTDTPVVGVTDPNGVRTVVSMSAPDANGSSTAPQIAGAVSGAYVYDVTVGGDAQPSVTFTRSYPRSTRFPRVNYYGPNGQGDYTPKAIL